MARYEISPDDDWRIYKLPIYTPEGKSFLMYFVCADVPVTSGNNFSRKGGYEDGAQKVFPFFYKSMPLLSLHLTEEHGYPGTWQETAVAVKSGEPIARGTLTRSGVTYYYYYMTGDLYGDSTFGYHQTYSCIALDSYIWVHTSDDAFFRLDWQLSISRFCAPQWDETKDPFTNITKIPSANSTGQVSPASLISDSEWNPNFYTGDYAVAIEWGPESSTIGYMPRNPEIALRAEVVIENNDPYGDDSDGSGGFGGSGGDGSRESWDDTIGVPDMPGLTLGSLGSMGIFTPSASQLTSFFQYLWSDAFSVDGFKKILSDPMQAIISLHALPCAVGAGSSAEVAFGNISTGVSMPHVSSEWLTVDCGSIPFKKYYGSFFDYSPYTKYQIYLPYIGYKDISPDDFVGGDCHVVYHVHVPSGACMCYLISGAVDGSVLYQFGGSCLMQLPITSGTYNNFVGSIVTGLASGASALGNISSVAGKVASGALSAAASASSAVASLGSVLSSKPTVSRSGTISGAAGWMARQIPYVIRTRPNAVLTENLNSFQGYPLYRSRMLSQMSGYTVVEDIHLSGLSATADEADEIERLLKEGVIF